MAEPLTVFTEAFARPFIVFIAEDAVKVKVPLLVNFTQVSLPDVPVEFPPVWVNCDVVYTTKTSPEPPTPLVSFTSFAAPPPPPPVLAVPAAPIAQLSFDAGSRAVLIGLDPGLSADGKWTGITLQAVAGTTLVFGDLVYLAVADTRWELADADAAATAGDVQLGICVLAAAADGDPTVILLYGNVRSAAFPSFTVGAPLYVSTDVGDITHTKPSGTDDVVRVVGFALTADDLMFNPSPDYITHT